jgi:hypothetical protein
MEMTPTIPSSLAKDSLSTINRVAEQPDSLSAAQAWELAAACSISASVLEKYWWFASSLLDRSAEGRALAFVYKELADVLTEGGRTYAAVRGKIAASALPDDDRSQVAEMLLEFEAQGRRWLDEVRELVDWIEAGHPPVDPGRLTPDSGAQDASGFVGLDAFLDGFTADR